MLIHWSRDNYRKANLSWQSHEGTETEESHSSTQLHGAGLQIVAASQTLSHLRSNPPIFILIILCCCKCTLLTLANCGISGGIVDIRNAVKNLCSPTFRSDRFTVGESAVSTQSSLGGPKSRTGLFGQKKYLLPVQVIGACLYCLVPSLYRDRCSD